MLVDSHVHLDMNQFKDDLDDVVARARAAGVGEMLQVCYDARSVDATIALTRRYGDVYGALGIHPHDAKIWDEAIEKRIKEGLLLKRIVAVGETGLDYYRDLSPRERQREVFRRQIGIAPSAAWATKTSRRPGSGSMPSSRCSRGPGSIGPIFCWSVSRHE